MNHRHQDAGARRRVDWKIVFLLIYFLVKNEQTLNKDHCLQLYLKKTNEPPTTFKQMLVVTIGKQ